MDSEPVGSTRSTRKSAVLVPRENRQCSFHAKSQPPTRALFVLARLRRRRAPLAAADSSRSRVPFPPLGCDDGSERSHEGLWDCASL